MTTNSTNSWDEEGSPVPANRRHLKRKRDKDSTPGSKEHDFANSDDEQGYPTPANRRHLRRHRADDDYTSRSKEPSKVITSVVSRRRPIYPANDPVTQKISGHKIFELEKGTPDEKQMAEFARKVLYPGKNHYPPGFGWVSNRYLGHEFPAHFKQGGWIEDSTWRNKKAADFGLPELFFRAVDKATALLKENEDVEHVFADVVDTEPDPSSDRPDIERPQQHSRFDQLVQNAAPHPTSETGRGRATVQAPEGHSSQKVAPEDSVDIKVEESFPKTDDTQYQEVKPNQQGPTSTPSNTRSSRPLYPPRTTRSGPKARLTGLSGNVPPGSAAAVLSSAPDLSSASASSTHAVSLTSAGPSMPGGTSVPGDSSSPGHPAAFRRPPISHDASVPSRPSAPGRASASDLALVPGLPFMSGIPTMPGRPSALNHPFAPGRPIASSGPLALVNLVTPARPSAFSVDHANPAAPESRIFKSTSNDEDKNEDKDEENAEAEDEDVTDADDGTGKIFSRPGLERDFRTFLDTSMMRKGPPKQHKADTPNSAREVIELSTDEDGTVTPTPAASRVQGHPPASMHGPGSVERGSESRTALPSVTKPTGHNATNPPLGAPPQMAQLQFPRVAGTLNNPRTVTNQVPLQTHISTDRLIQPAIPTAVSIQFTNNVNLVAQVLGDFPTAPDLPNFYRLLQTYIRAPGTRKDITSTNLFAYVAAEAKRATNVVASIVQFVGIHDPGLLRDPAKRSWFLTRMSSLRDAGDSEELNRVHHGSLLRAAGVIVRKLQ